LWDLFPDRLVDSELGEIPEGWEVKALGEVLELNPREPMKRGTIAPYIEMAALPTSSSCPDEAVLREFTSGTRFRNGDTLLARITPCLENGKTAFVQSLPEDIVGWGSTEFIVMRAIPPVPAEYPYLLGREEGFREHAIQSMTGTSGRQRVQVDALAPYLLPFPPTDVWATFSSLVGPMFVDIEITRKQSYSLAAQRDALLPKLVSGELRTVGLL
jgi:type I restriction enzyme S subunit